MRKNLLDGHSFEGVQLQQLINEVLSCLAETHLLRKRVVAHPNLVICDVHVVLFVLERQPSYHQSVSNHPIAPQINLIGVS